MPNKSSFSRYPVVWNKFSLNIALSEVGFIMIFLVIYLFFDLIIAFIIYILLNIDKIIVVEVFKFKFFYRKYVIIDIKIWRQRKFN